MTEPKYIDQGASFDDERIYRYRLWRRWAPGPMCLWIMLNPSTADETKLDPTLRRCLGFTRNFCRRVPRAHAIGTTAIGIGYELEEYGAFEVCNLYALRSTDPAGLWSVRDPIGPGNDAAIQSAAKRADLVIVGWGVHAKPERERQVAQLLADVGVQPRALRLTKDGSPGHPLYVPGDAEPLLWQARGLR